MSYENGNFYHIDKKQYIENVSLVNCLINGATILTGTGVPVGGAPAGSLYIRTQTGSVSLYQNIGTELLPQWALFNSVDEGVYILTYSIPTQEAASVIDSATYTVGVLMPYGTDVTDLVATFTLSKDATAEVGLVNQDSGVTSNDFTTPVTYTVTAEDGTTTQDWVVTITLAPNHEAELSVMTIPSQVGATVYDIANRAITINMPALTDPTALVATFTISAEASAYVGDTLQSSGVTANNFTSPVVYKVVAEDGVTNVEYTVTVDIAE